MLIMSLFFLDLLLIPNGILTEVFLELEIMMSMLSWLVCNIKVLLQCGGTKEGNLIIKSMNVKLEPAYFDTNVFVYGLHFVSVVKLT